MAHSWPAGADCPRDISGFEPLQGTRRPRLLRRAEEDCTCPPAALPRVREPAATPDAEALRARRAVPGVKSVRLAYRKRRHRRAAIPSLPCARESGGFGLSRVHTGRATCRAI